MQIIQIAPFLFNASDALKHFPKPSLTRTDSVWMLSGTAVDVHRFLMSHEL